MPHLGLDLLIIGTQHQTGLKKPSKCLAHLLMQVCWYFVGIQLLMLSPMTLNV